MPFIDLNTQAVAFSKDDFDFVIVGSGVAGILMALTLSDKGKKVLMLEAGAHNEDDLHQSLNEVIQTGKHLENAIWGRKRAIGGTTIAWGGQSLPFSEIDFQKRDWVAESGWPIELKDIVQYYPPANRFMNVDEGDYSNETFRTLKMKNVPVNNDLLTYHISKWAPQPNFVKLYEERLKNQVTLVYNAAVTKIVVDSNGKATALAVKNFNKQEYTIDVSCLLLATGAIEANRLLLASNDTETSGVGNSSGWVGKCYMDHPCVEVGFVATHNQYALQKAFNTHLHQGRKYSVRLSLSEQAQRKQQLLNSSTGIMFDYLEGQFDPYIEIRNYINTRKISSLGQVFKNATAYAISAKALFADKLIYKHKARARMVMMLEQEPLTSSNITLSEERDVLGMPKAKLNWQISRKSWDTVIATAGHIKNELQRLSFGNLSIHEHINPNNENWTSHLTDVCHHMGGTRMSSTKNNGVVDSNMKLWGYDNIYVCSCSVFPTVSHSNPTLTMMALCLRLADQLTR
ncbi:MAG: GMC family oxidoreductase [Bacteroidetes bacterium]|nr:GMC family oxidoreductase [Bacteroidota bacterium]